MFANLLLVGVFLFLGFIVFRTVHPTGNASKLGAIMGGKRRSRLKHSARVAQVDFPPTPVHLSHWGIHAKVVLDFRISPEGKAMDIRVVDATHQEVVRPIVEAISRGKFIPALDEQDQPIVSRMRLPVSIGEQINYVSGDFQANKLSARERVRMRSLLGPLSASEKLVPSKHP